jgi:hypothetical protein
MKKSKTEKIARENEKQTRALVKEAFHAKKFKGKTNPMVESLVKSVIVNRAVLKKEEKAKKDWQESYYQNLFIQFRALVDRHNEILGVEVVKLNSEIASKKIELKMLKAEIKRYEANLELKEAKKHA